MDTNSTAPIDDLPVSEAWALVRSVPVGRLAVIDHGHPDIFPINHVVDHGSVVLRTSQGAKLAAAAGHPVAFEVDGYDAEAGEAWSVVIKGRAVTVTHLYDLLEALDLPLFPWHSGAKPHFLRIEPTTVSGRRFHVAGGHRSSATR